MTISVSGSKPSGSLFAIADLTAKGLGKGVELSAEALLLLARGLFGGSESENTDQSPRAITLPDNPTDFKQLDPSSLDASSIETLTSQIASRFLNPDNTSVVALPTETSADVCLPDTISDISGPFTTGLDQIADATHDVAKDILSDIPQASIAENLATGLPANVKTITQSSKKLIGGWLPIIAWLLYHSKEMHLRNINLHINATKLITKYCFTLIKGKNEHSLAFKVQAGRPVAFGDEAEIEGISSTLPPPLFQPESLWDTLGPLKHMAWRRQEHETLCNIIITDAGNPELRKGPVIQTIPLSEKETMRIIRQDPKFVQAPIPFDTLASAKEAASFASMHITDIDLSRTTTYNARIPLATPENPNSHDEFIHVSQDRPRLVAQNTKRK